MKNYSCHQPDFCLAHTRAQSISTVHKNAIIKMQRSTLWKNNEYTFKLNKLSEYNKLGCSKWNKAMRPLLSNFTLIFIVHNLAPKVIRICQLSLICRLNRHSRIRFHVYMWVHMWLFIQDPLENAARVSEACRPALEVRGFRFQRNSPQGDT